jgi:hypothetical protein
MQTSKMLVLECDHWDVAWVACESVNINSLIWFVCLKYTLVSWNTQSCVVVVFAIFSSMHESARKNRLQQFSLRHISDINWFQCSWRSSWIRNIVNFPTTPRKFTAVLDFVSTTWSLNVGNSVINIRCFLSIKIMARERNISYFLFAWLSCR